MKKLPTITSRKTGIISFRYRLLSSPDFMAELRKWGDGGGWINELKK